MREPKTYFVATNGTITIWRPMRRARFYHSATIKGFTRSWRSSRPSGPCSYPAVQISLRLFNELLAARELSGHPFDDWIANEHLPAAVREALALAAVDELVDQIEAEAEIGDEGSDQLLFGSAAQ